MQDFDGSFTKVQRLHTLKIPRVNMELFNKRRYSLNSYESMRRSRVLRLTKVDYVMGDTFARSEITGEDEYFQFILPKAKVTSENTITMEAEGDPSVFNLNLEVLRATLTDEDGNSEKVMMKLVKYDVDTQ